MTYHDQGLFDLVKDVTILFQDASQQDYDIANHFGLNFIAIQNNIGIGMGLLKLAKVAEERHILLLEHDWKLIEPKQITFDRLNSGLKLLDKLASCVRYRHRTNPGYPHFSIDKYRGRELDYFDDYYKMKFPHLLDSVHWKENPAQDFPEFITKYNAEYYVSSSRYGNWTNNPCLFNRQFYIDCVERFIVDDQITSEGEIAIWWANQDYTVAHGEGLFMHHDPKKYGALKY